MSSGPTPTPPAIQLADRARAMRLFLHRRLDQLYDELTSVGFTGTMRIELSAKDGRPGEPRHSLEVYGIGNLQ